MKIKKYLKPSGPLKPAKVYLDGKWVELESHGGGELSAGGRLFKVNSKPKSATGNKEIVVTPKGNTIINKEDLKPEPIGYSSAFHSEDTIPFINTLTFGGLNNLSPTLWIRRAYDTKKLLSGNMDWSNYTNSWINGNNGIVSNLFAEKHPYWSTGINLVGDVATLGGIAGIKKLTNILKPNVNIAADIGTTAKQGTTALSLEEILKAFEAARQWHLNRINSPKYKDRALRAGFTEEEVPQLLQLLTRLINSLRLQNKEKLFPSTFSKDEFVGRINAEYWALPTNKGMYLGISFYNPNMSYDEAVSKFIHEFGHGATFGLNGNETTGLAGQLSKQFPLITKAVLYNKSLFPEVTEETVKKVFPLAEKEGLLNYYSKPTELFARGYEFMRDYANSWWKLKNSGKSFTNLDAINNATNNRLNSKLFRGFTGDLGAYNFQKNALGISVPLGLGGYGLYDDLQQQLQYLKQGGKLKINNTDI